MQTVTITYVSAVGVVVASEGTVTISYTQSEAGSS